MPAGSPPRATHAIDADRRDGSAAAVGRMTGTRIIVTRMTLIRIIFLRLAGLFESLSPTNLRGFDHFFLADTFFDGSGWDLDGALVLNGPPWADSAGSPLSYNARSGSGLSDHLPLVISLKRPRS